MPPDPRPLLSVGDLPTSGPAYLQSVGDLATRMGEPLPDAPTRAVEPAAPPPGYVVEKELGRGAFGVVYLARHKDDPDTPVALKVVRAHGTLDRLLLEPALLARLDHPNVVRVLDYFPHPDGRHLVMALEYVGGGDLKAAIDECDRFPPGVVREVLVQLGGALAEAHAKGVVHRDLKPANVLLDRSAGAVRYVLTDFGVGGEDGGGLRAAKTVAGTYLFMAPEQLRGRPGPQSDLWALGVVAYRMLTGAYPFPGPSAADLARQIQLATPAPPSAVLGEPIDPDLERAVLRLLDRSETERIGSAAELLRALGAGEARTGLFGRVRPRTDSRLGERVRSLGDTLDRDYERSRRRMRVWAGLYLVAGSVVGGAAGVWAAVLFYRAQLAADRRGRRRRLAWAFALAFAAAALAWAEVLGRQVLFGAVTKAYPPAAVAVSLFGLFSGVGQWVFPILAANAFARGNRLRRERVLLRAAAGGAGDDYLALLRQELDNRYEDVGFHLKYAEALAARGDDRAAAVEARLLLVQDPYHFAGNLLLAQCYLRLGLPADCRRVCDDYLAVAGYCFEFAELRDQCGKAGAA